MLEELPETLDETYERILRDINKAIRAHAHRLLQCLTVAVRPLRVAELAEILAVDFGTASHGGMSKLNTDWRWADQQHAVLSTCSSLISVVDDEDSQVVQFSHFSVKEFLTSSRLADSSADVSRFHILSSAAHTILARACLGVLLQLDEHVDEDNVEKNFPLARYAAEHWVDHVQLENVPSDIREGMGYLFDPDKPHFATWLQVHDIDTPPRLPSALYLFCASESNTTTPLYYAAFCGFHDLAEQLIMKHPQQVNANCGYYVSPLGAALAWEHLDIAQLLYEHGADVDVRGQDRRTPLISAPSHGHCEIVEWLLSHGANPNLQSDGKCFTPLHMAAWFGRVEVSRILLQHKVDQNILDKDGQTPLHTASYKGHIEVARLLLKHGVDVNAQDSKRSTALHLALEERHIDVARLLLEHGADVNNQNGDGQTSLHQASERGRIDVARWLLEHDVDVNAVDSKRSTAFHVALEKRHIDVARLLLEHGVEVNTQDSNGRTPFHIASSGGEVEIFWILLQHKTGQNTLDNNGLTPLHLALQVGHVDIARLLLEHGADVNTHDSDGRTPLHLVSQEGHIEIVRLLLKHGADVNALDNNHSTALHLVSHIILGDNKHEVACLLLEHGAGVVVQDDKGRTTFQAVSGQLVHDEITDFLSDWNHQMLRIEV